MKKSKTREEKLWDYLSKKLGSTKVAKQVFNRIRKEFRSKSTEVAINYKVDTRPLVSSIALVKRLNNQLDKIRIRK